MIDTVAWLNPSNSSTCAMQSEGMLPQSFYMRGWMNNTYVVGVGAGLGALFMLPLHTLETWTS